jgi:hypothetical protein
MAEDLANFAAASIFLLIFSVTIFPIMQVWDGFPPAYILSSYGVTPGEFYILALIIIIVVLWSIFQFATTVLTWIILFLCWIITHETVRNFAGAIGRKANRTIGRKIRTFIRDIRRDMRGHDSL